MLYSGYEIVVGKNARDNDKLVLTSNSSDMWFHVKDAPGRHVVVRCGYEDLRPDVVRYAASLASGGSKVDVIYTRIINVTKNKYSKNGEVHAEDYLTIRA